MTTVRVREVLTLPALRGTTVEAGEAGLDRPVLGVNVMEVPDIEAFVKGGELLLTTAYPLRGQPARLPQLVRTLDALGVAAIAIKTGRYLDAIPHEVLQAGQDCAFPVLHLPDDTSFNDVIEALLAVVITEHSVDTRRTEVIRERLTEVALTGGGLTEIARTLAGAIEREVRIVDADGVVLGESAQQWQTSAAWSFPVTVAGNERGRIEVGRADEPTLGERRLIRQAGFAAGMHVAQALASIDLDRHMRVLFLEDLVTGRALGDEVLRERSRLYGWQPERPHVVLLARCEAEVAEVGVAAGAGFLSPGAVAWSRGTEVVALVPVGEAERTGPILHRWREHLLRHGGGGVTVASGPVAHRSQDLPVAHERARDALAVAAARGSSVVAYEDFALERLLLAMPRELLSEFVTEQIGPLLAADAAGADLCTTLETYLGLGNAAEAARRLYVHYNTMKHRLARIATLLPVSLQDPGVRVTLSVALQARHLVSAAP